ncbi:MAG TPA: nitroreductase family protein [Methanotrichaceae archaeon]|nr:nitroreductase family protein [Methanotrichaceae archaeon]
MRGDLDIVLEYHQATKHRPTGYARGPAGLDWANEPNPFRRYMGSEQIPLEKLDLGEKPEKLDKSSISRLFYGGLALSAWKQSGGAKWSLRVNPSSGDLHPTEGYLISGPISGLIDEPGVFHYSPQVHGLELRARIPHDAYESLGLPEGTVLIALSSIFWRESWKYGERAFRYCQLDVGHALAALSVSASCLGWHAALIDGLSTDQIGLLAGISGGEEGETERPDCLIAIQSISADGKIQIAPEVLEHFRRISWLGTPNRLSREHVSWPIIGMVAEAVAKPRTEDHLGPKGAGAPNSWCKIARSRRSAQSMDGRTVMPQELFYRILGRVIPGRTPFDALPWPAQVHMALFVHRVQGLGRGLYMLVRDPGQSEAVKSCLRDDFSWERPPGCPDGLGLRLLALGDAREAAKISSCRQDIASDGCFCAAMIALFEEPLHEKGPWFYPRLHWECGMIGQTLYLGAEESGLKGCGIGCFLDDVVHSLLGIKSREYQDLYHFTVGMAVEDKRLTTLPAYS